MRPAAVEPSPVVRTDLGTTLQQYFINCDLPVPSWKVVEGIVGGLLKELWENCRGNCGKIVKGIVKDILVIIEDVL